MRRKLLGSLALLLALGGGMHGQSAAPILGGNISASSSNCSTSFSCVWQNVLPINAGTTTIAITGTFTATLLVEESNNGGQSWATAATLSAAGTTTYSTNGFTDIRVRCSAYTSGTATVTISTGLLQVQSVVSAAGGGVSITTVSGLNSVSGKTKGTIAVVTDGNSATDCATGAASTVVVCQYSGSTWSQMVAASSGATGFAAITGGTNAAALVMGTGGSLTVSGTGTVNATNLNGTSLAGLATGIVKNTTATGVPSIAVAGDFPTLNQNTSGTAANLSGTPALPNGTTATTQAAASNDTKLATDAYVDGHFIASGTAALGTSAIASGACATVVTATATGTATTDVITTGFNGDPTAVTGYGASATGAVLTIYPYPTTNTANFKVCNSTASSITPSALTLNWKVTR